MLSEGSLSASGCSSLPYAALLVLAKLGKAVGIFLAYECLKTYPLVYLLLLVQLCTCVFLVVLQRPFSKRVSRPLWLRVARHSVLDVGFLWMWLLSLSLCGPVRAIFLYEHSDVVVLSALAVLLGHSANNKSKWRGFVCLLVALLTLLLFDNDAIPRKSDESQTPSQGVLWSVLSLLTSSIGLSDHKGGVALLSLLLVLRTGFHSAARTLSVDLGGSKRLHTLSTVVSVAFLLPLAVFTALVSEASVSSWWGLLVSALSISFLAFVVDFYAEAACQHHLESGATARIGTCAVLLWAVAIAPFWNHPHVVVLKGMHQIREVVAEEHAISGAALVALVLLLLATSTLSAPGSKHKGSLVGYSAGGLPLYSFTSERFQLSSQSVLLFAKNSLREVLSRTDSRRIFYFLCINLAFTAVEMVYGVWTNSLGLLSDAFHMLFDCSSLVMGLSAAVMSRWKPTRIFSYGYERVEVLSGFVNGLFLAVIAFFVFVAAVGRLFDPPEVNTDRLLMVSVAGLFVNLIGLAVFGHAHANHGQSSQQHGHCHGDAHQHGHQHGHSHGHSHTNANMTGVFLHVLADTLGSVGVIISSLLIEYRGWRAADPVCSLFIATMILASIVPLLTNTARVLLLATPDGMQSDIAASLQKLLQVEGVLSFREPHFWLHSTDALACSIHVQVVPTASEQRVLAQVGAILKDMDAKEASVQIEKELFFHHMAALGMDLAEARRRNTFASSIECVHAV